MGHIYTKKIFIVYLQFKFNWASYILSGNAIPGDSEPEGSFLGLAGFIDRGSPRLVAMPCHALSCPRKIPV